MERPTPVPRWTIIDIDELRDWPPYTQQDAERFAFVDWPEACRLALALVTIGDLVSPIEIRDDLPSEVRIGIELLLILHIDATPDQLVDGGHRLLAMKKQGVRYTVGIAYTDS